MVLVVPQYTSLRRRHGQLMKDFGLLKHQRKEVRDLVLKFMHKNSFQNFVRNYGETSDTSDTDGCEAVNSTPYDSLPISGVQSLEEGT